MSTTNNEYYEYSRPIKIYLVDMIINTKKKCRSVKAPLPINTKSRKYYNSMLKKEKEQKELDAEMEQFKEYNKTRKNDHPLTKTLIMPWGQSLSQKLLEQIHIHNPSMVDIINETAIEKDNTETNTKFDIKIDNSTPPDKDVKTSEKRCGAFDILKDKEKIASVMERTSFCKSVHDKNGKIKPATECSLYGDKCRFAHNKDELKIKKCLFGDDCKFVKITKTGKYQNEKGKCSYIHKGEPLGDYFSRLGYIINIKTQLKIRKPLKMEISTLEISTFKTSTQLKPAVSKHISYASAVAPLVYGDKPFVLKPTEITKPAVKLVLSPKPLETGWQTVSKKKYTSNPPLDSKTRSVDVGTKHMLCSHNPRCRFKGSCKFAHSLNELIECRWGDACKNVIYEHGKFHNCNGKYRVCSYKHPGETFDNVFERTVKTKK